MIRARLVGLMQAASYFLLLSGCWCGGGSDATAANDDRAPSCGTTVRVLTSLAASPDSLVLQVGESSTIQLVGFDERGAPVTVSRVNWSSSNAGVATVDRFGLVRGVAAGNATVVAEAPVGVRAAVAVSVLPHSTGR